MLPQKFTYPFCYVPHPLIREAADALIARIDASAELRALFAEGKMMGALLVEMPGQAGHDADPRPDAALSSDTVPSPPTPIGGPDTAVLYAFSGVAGGRAVVDGFVPPIYDLTEPGGYYRAAEARITEINLLPIVILSGAKNPDPSASLRMTLWLRWRKRGTRCRWRCRIGFSGIIWFPMRWGRP